MAKSATSEAAAAAAAGCDGEASDMNGDGGDSGLTPTGPTALDVAVDCHLNTAESPPAPPSLLPMAAMAVIDGDVVVVLTGTLIVTKGMCIVFAMASMTGRVVSLATPNTAKIPCEIIQHTATDRKTRQPVMS